MRQYIFLLLVCYSTVHASPLNLFVNSTTDDRPDLEIIDGDIAFIAGTAPELAGPRNAYIRSAKWVNGVLPYVISSAFTAIQRQTIINSMRKVEEQTGNCIRFVQQTNQASYINIINGQGCWSYMGKQYSNAKQDISLQIPGCVYQNIAIHELLHAVGFAHEQTRPDRDQYVTINYNNIQSGTESNFQRYLTNDVNTFGKAYDFSSIMHYKSTAFSKNGQPTIVGKNSTHTPLLGSATTMTNLDIEKVKAYYNCA